VQELSERVRSVELLVDRLVNSVDEVARQVSMSTDAATSLQHQLNNAKAVNAELNAASRAGDKASAARQGASAAMAEAINHLQTLASDQADEIDLLRNAITQTSVPDTLP
jgi:methyl-accepting chemotaxis protein